MWPHCWPCSLLSSSHLVGETISTYCSLCYKVPQACLWHRSADRAVLLHLCVSQNLTDVLFYRIQFSSHLSKKKKPEWFQRPLDQSFNPVKESSCILLWILAWRYAECHNDCCDISLHIFHQGVKSSWCLELLTYFSKPLPISAWERCAVIALGLVEYHMLSDCEFPLNPGDSYSLFENYGRKMGRECESECNELLQASSYYRPISVGFSVWTDVLLGSHSVDFHHIFNLCSIW